MASGKLECQIYGTNNNYPVKTDNEGRVFSSTVSDATTYSQMGRLYSVTTRPLPISAHNFLTVVLTNPALSGKSLFIQRVGMVNYNNTYLRLYRNPTVTDPGLPLPSLNQNWQAPDNSSANAKYVTGDSDPISGGNLLNGFYTYMYWEDFGGTLIIPSGATDRTFGVQIYNDQATGFTVNIQIVWYELDLIGS